MGLIIFILILLVVVLVHEFGHFYAAKKFGMRVDEFGFGIPPKALTLYKKGETEYSLNWLPIGGFVRIFGENPDEESISGDDSSRSFVNKPKWQQAVVLVAGVFMNFILAWLLYSLAFGLGSPLVTDSIPDRARQKMTESNLVVFTVGKESPAERAGLEVGDYILSISSGDSELVKPQMEEFSEFTDKPGQTLTMEIQRNEVISTIEVIPEFDVESQRAKIGITPNILQHGDFSFVESVKYGLDTAVISGKDTLAFIGKLFKGKEESREVKESVIGPVGLFKLTQIVYKIGFGYLLSFMAAISISLAVLNIIPFPALDGGRLLFVLIEKIKGSIIKPKIANTINLVGFVVLILLILLVTIGDISRFYL